MPSTSTRGFWFPVNVEIPLIQNWASSFPGSPEVCTAMIPATLPAMELLSDLTGTRSSSGLIEATAPTTDSFFCVPKPTTTVSARRLLSSTRDMVTFCDVFTRRVCEMNPMNDISTREPEGIVMENAPSKSATAPNGVLDSSKVTLAPGNGCPSVSVMTPDRTTSD